MFTSAKELTQKQRTRMAASGTAIHQTEAQAPPYFVQVTFDTVVPGAIRIGGEVASPDDLRAGRTAARKAKILIPIMKDTSTILGISDSWA